jgi:glycosidase
MPRPDDANAFNSDLFAWYKKMISLRNSNPVLQTGKCEFLASDDIKDVFAFARTSDTELVLVVVNNSIKEQKFVLPLPKQYQNRVWRDLLGEEQPMTSTVELTVVVGPKSGKVFGS